MANEKENKEQTASPEAIIAALQIYKKAVEDVSANLLNRCTLLRGTLSAICFTARSNLDQPTENSIETVKLAVEKVIASHGLEKDISMMQKQIENSRANPGIMKVH